jgi:hypothetical protein
VKKRCSRCKRTKDLSLFNSRPTGKLGKSSHCKECHSAYTRDHYARHKPYYVRKAMAWNEVRHAEMVAVINEAKDKPCVDCGNRFPAVAMDLDHVRGTKVMEISKFRGQKTSIQRLREEIAKCEVRCAVCHRLRTHPHLALGP